MQMSNKTVEFYELRASEAADEARKATLENVRQRALRSESAWREMAKRAISVEQERARRIAEADRMREAE